MYTQELQAFLEERVDAATYGKLTKVNKQCRWCDTVAAQGIQNIQVVSIPREDKINAYISGRLAHIIINPSNRKDDIMALASAYVYSERRGAVNLNENSVKHFLDQLCDVSVKNRESFLAKTEIEKQYHVNTQSVSLLVGDRGVGKTFFLNHVLAKYSNYLDKKRVIWVRLNLVDTFGVNTDLNWWMYAQATKIILRYYCIDSKYFDKAYSKKPIQVLPFVRSWINGIAEDGTRRDMNMSLQGLIDVFLDNATDEPISPGLIPKLLARKIWESAIRDGGYSFIVIFDGMDRLAAIPGQKYNIQKQQLIACTRVLHMNLYTSAVMTNNIMSNSFNKYCRNE